MTPHDSVSLAAQSRMERDLPSLRRAVSRAAGRRRALRIASVASLALVPAIVLWTRPSTPTPPAGDRHAVIQPPVPPVPTPSPTGIRVVRVETDPGITGRLAASPASRVETLDDAELARALADAGRPRGLVRIGGRTLWEGDFALARPPTTSP